LKILGPQSKNDFEMMQFLLVQIHISDLQDTDAFIFHGWRVSGFFMDVKQLGMS